MKEKLDVGMMDSWVLQKIRKVYHHTIIIFAIIAKDVSVVLVTSSGNLGFFQGKYSTAILGWYRYECT